MNGIFSLKFYHLRCYIWSSGYKKNFWRSKVKVRCSYTKMPVYRISYSIVHWCPFIFIMFLVSFSVKCFIIIPPNLQNPHCPECPSASISSISRYQLGYSQVAMADSVDNGVRGAITGIDFVLRPAKINDCLWSSISSWPSSPACL